MNSLAARGDCDIVYPLHLNPEAMPGEGRFDGVSNIKLVRPMDFISFVFLLERADLILTDSGGIQEEATALGKPVLLMREVTERPEAVGAGTVRLVGTDASRILGAANHLLDNANTLAVMSRPSSAFGDGCAAGRIVDAIEEWEAAVMSPQDRAALSR
jgi:UDP-N-acetylglucosamine 2-epimerase (non-hydrolysing)